MADFDVAGEDRWDYIMDDGAGEIILHYFCFGICSDCFPDVFSIVLGVKNVSVTLVLPLIFPYRSDYFFNTGFRGRVEFVEPGINP